MKLHEFIKMMISQKRLGKSYVYLVGLLELLLNVVSLSGILIGLTIVIIAQTMKSPSHPPVPSFNVKHWKPVWLMKDWFTPKGFKYHITGWTIFTVGILIQVFQIIR